jgi:hypothetical protein
LGSGLSFADPGESTGNLSIYLCIVEVYDDSP